MLKRDESANPASCWNKARDDEMTFVLLGRDPAFAAAVRFWIGERIRLRLNRPDDPKLSEAEAYAAAVAADHLAKHNPTPGVSVERCVGHGTSDHGPKCCDRAGEYNGFGSDGPRLFECPGQCSCHD